MKKTFLILYFLLILIFQGYPQKVDSLIQNGSKLRNSGLYQQAINEYKKALKIEKNSTEANYQIAYTYLFIQDYKSSIKYCNKVIRSNSTNTFDAYMLKGSALDFSNKQDQSIKLYKGALKRFPDSYLLHFNLGVSYYNHNQIEEAINEYLKSIKLNNLHPSSHLMLALIMKEKGLRVRSILSLYFFLLLEPDTKRSIEAYRILQEQWAQYVEVNQGEPKSIRIMLNPTKDSTDFNSLDLAISTIESGKYKPLNSDLNKYEMFTVNTSSLFSLLQDLKETKDSDVWTSLYASFFNRLNNANLSEPFCYYISTSCNDELIGKWYNQNKHQIELFAMWANEQLTKK